jgi:hypothetical protein
MSKKPILRHAPQFHMLTATTTAKKHSLIQIIDEPLVWARPDKGVWFEVPVGFVFDGASVPNILYPVLSATPLDLIIPGACHDYLYRKDATAIDVPSGKVRSVERDEADAVMKDVCKYVGVDKADCDKIFFGIRAGGWPSFRKRKVAWRP